MGKFAIIILVNNMKDLNFLKSNFIAYHGIYDNERIFENTLQSIARANKFGYIIQLDVKMTGCGTLICFHDNNLERMLHVDQDLLEISYDELSYIAKYQIPTLEEVLDLVKGNVPLILKLETKMKGFLFEKAVASVLDNYEGEFAIISDNKKTLKWFYKNRREYVSGFLIESNTQLKSLFFKKCDFFSMNISLVNDKYVRKLRENRFIIGFVVRSSEEFNQKRNVYDNLVIDNILENAD